ncbi:MAG: sodium:solute symporter family protein [Bacteroidota bacterium]
MGEFLGKLTVAEAMGDLYGDTVRRITALSGILKAAGALAIQFQVFSRILTLIFGIQGDSVFSRILTPIFGGQVDPMIFIAALIVVTYSAFGGIRAVTFTDVLQFFTFGTFIPILALVVYNSLNQPEQVIHTLATNPMFDFRAMFGWNPSFITALGVLLYSVIPAMESPIFQRIAMSRDTLQVKHAFSLAAVVCLLIAILVSWVGVLLLTQDATLNPKELVNYLIHHYTYPGLKGLIGIGIIAMSMSTADSFLNSSAVLLVHDLLGIRGVTERYRIVAARSLAVSIGFFALLLALRIDNLLQLLLVSGSFVMPIYTVPFLLAIFGFRSSTRAVLIGMAFGFCTVVIWRMLAFSMDAITPGMLANLVGLLGSHYLLGEKGGWVGIKDQVPLLAARQKRALAWQRFKDQVRGFSLPRYLQNNLPKKEYTFSLFGIYIIAATYASLYTVDEGIRASYGALYSIIYHSVLIITPGLLTYPVWPPTLKGKHFTSWVWPLSIFYILFVAGFWLVIMSGFHEFQVMIFLLNLVMATLLLSWPLALGLAAVGIITAVQVFRIYTGEHTLPGSLGSLQF